MNIRSRMLKVANNIIADYDYVYDPQHEKNPGGGYQRTEKGWSKDKTDRKNQGGNSGKIDEKKIIDSMTDEQKRLHQMALSDDFYEQENAASSKKSHQYTLEKLSDSKNFRIRTEVASNPKTSKKTLLKLTKDNFSRSHVAGNPSSDDDVLKSVMLYANDEEPNSFLNVLSHPNSSAETFGMAMSKFSKTTTNYDSHYFNRKVLPKIKEMFREEMSAEKITEDYKSPRHYDY